MVLGFPFEKGEVGAVYGLRLRSGVTARAFAALLSSLSPHRYILYTKGRKKNSTVQLL